METRPETQDDIEESASDAQASPDANDEPGPEVARFGEIEGDAVRGAEVDLDAILDVPVTLGLEVGRATITIGELLRLNQGSVVELGRSAVEPMDVLVNGTLVARGEIVVVDDKFGIRLVDVVTPAERIRKLK